MYLLFSPAIASLVVIAYIQIRDAFTDTDGNTQDPWS